ncbi:alanine/glycine:cation symporter family protein [Virgibacillus halodenitrificans]|uniref:Sodium:alanine symporter family protein n=1 Tax=Virgibacillus halodenitrificans TaxID=1482 RepID=A0AAC9NK78_VIRHA|nr:sodium:alanine symporter family protein [Virgibacillus halodenitrificans]APC47231.1 sodium:alanine symporter family protein [Virgibacillus halodenitrificans]MBD1223675.1 sodium:alanine symporter family protein [Virgibacillus halodenitrificans]MCG1028052.1 sodium:alanine symporter family protein [Virgibacillus halodenitrificans]MCJ0933334.1 sodium:alanine symporter family protein [Virgibacillus halodenitrificans]MEC2159330.1 sodium:alanine symporter family protein [Virgibacillus halodenitrif
MNEILDAISGFVWGPPTLILIVGTGLYLTFRLGFLQFRVLPYALKLAFSPSKQDKKSKGDISHYQALTTAMAATIGTGNIVGVATAVVLGGPGAVFWMWLSALFGMATKYAEAILAVKYRVTNSKGEMSGGPMYYLERGLKAKWLGVLFAIFGACAAFGIGNMVQSNSVSDALERSFNIPGWATGIILTVLVGLVILGGIKSIGRVTAFFVPIMAALYVLGGLIIIIMNLDIVPAAIGLIFSDAFTGSALGGGILGTVIRYGVARGVFSNEAGLGSAPIAAAAAKTDYPGRQALVSMTQVFIDTIIVCSITGITIVMANMYGGDLSGGDLTAASFGKFLGDFGGMIVTIGIVLFAFSTLVGWSYYGEKCFGYLFSEKAIPYYRIVFVAAVFYGAVEKLSVVWAISDIMNALMAAPNLIGLLGLSGVVVYETKKFLKVAKEEKEQEKAQKAGRSA